MLFVWFLITAFLVVGVAYLSKKYGKEYLISLMVTFTLLANIVSGKIISVLGFVVPAGVVVYSLTYLITDVLAEYYSKKDAQSAVWAGFIANIFMVLVIYIVIFLSPVPFNQEYSRHFNAAFSLTPRIVLASMIAYLLSQNHDVWMFHLIKRKTRSRWLWLRNNLSTMLSQAIDTITFISIAFYGTVPLSALLSMILGQYVLKFLIALMDTPFIYLVGRMGRK